MRHKCSKARVFNSNLKIHDLKLVFQSFGNASGRHGEKCLIKPSGVNISKISNKDIVSVSINNLDDTDNDYRPSSDTPTHLILYKEFNDLGGVVHTHSLYATAWAQAKLAIPCLGTTQADYWKGDIPITRDLTDEEISNNYEHNTGLVIVEKLKELDINPLNCPGIIVANHGPFHGVKQLKKL